VILLSSSTPGAMCSWRGRGGTILSTLEKLTSRQKRQSEREQPPASGLRVAAAARMCTVGVFAL
jgi:hypothetical protein